MARMTEKKLSRGNVPTKRSLAMAALVLNPSLSKNDLRRIFEILGLQNLHGSEIAACRDYVKDIKQLTAPDVIGQRAKVAQKRAPENSAPADLTQVEAVAPIIQRAQPVNAAKAEKAPVAVEPQPITQPTTNAALPRIQVGTKLEVVNPNSGFYGTRGNFVRYCQSKINGARGVVLAPELQPRKTIAVDLVDITTIES